MKYTYIGIVAWLCCYGASAQQKQTVRFSERMSVDNARKHLMVLASDAYQGRETGTAGGKMAADYIRQQFETMGLKGPVEGKYAQDVAVQKVKFSQSLKIGGTSFTPIADFFGWATSVSMQGYEVKADSVLFAGYGLIDEGMNPYNDFDGQEITGKVVMILDPGPRDGSFRFNEKIKYLAFHKAKAVLLVSSVVDKKPEQLMNVLYTDQMLLNGSDQLKQTREQQGSMPLIFIGKKVADQLLAAGGTDLASITRKLEQTKKPASFKFKVDFSASASKAIEPVSTQNVLGFIPGNDTKLKNEVLVISAHYDHLGVTPYLAGTDKINNGADDNGSGTTGLLLIADAMAQAVKAGKGPKRSVLFVAFTGEEKGLLGSSWYTEHPVLPLENTIADLNTDMIGRVDSIYKTDNNYLYIIGADRLSKDLDSTLKETNRKYTGLKLDEKFNDPKDPLNLYFRSDHYNFAKHRIPVVFFFNGFHTDYHQPSDEVDKIDFPALVKRAKLVFFTAWELANAERRPRITEE